MTMAEHPKRHTFQYGIAADVPLELDVYLTASSPLSSDGTVLVFFHGGGLVGNNRGHISPYLIEASAARGWPVISVDYRLLPQATVEDILEDITSAWHFIIRDLPGKLPGFTCDPRRAVVAGQSAGGFLAYLAGAHFSPRPAAVFSIYAIATFNDPFYAGGVKFNGVSMPRERIANDLDSTTVCAGDDSVFACSDDSPTLTDLGDAERPKVELPRTCLYDYFVEVGHFPTVFGSSRDLDPLQLLDSAYPPTVTIHGTEDRVVPYYMSQRLVGKLQSLRVEAHLFEVEGADHCFELFEHAHEGGHSSSTLWSQHLEEPFLRLDDILRRSLVKQFK